MFRKTGIVSLALVACLVISTPVLSDTWNKKTVVTVNDTMQVPGATLQPGKYVFKLADSNSNRHIVQIFNEDESQIITTILAIPNYRLQPTGDTTLQLWETPSGTPAALRAWFYPGDNFGQEFAYPKDQATTLSATVNQEVPALSDEDQAALSSAGTQTEATEQARTTEPADTDTTTVETDSTMTAETRQEPAETETARQTESVDAIQSQSSEMARSESDVQEQETDRSQRAASDVGYQSDELPRTAGFLPLLGLGGLIALGGASLIRAVRRS